MVLGLGWIPSRHIIDNVIAKCGHKRLVIHGISNARVLDKPVGAPVISIGNFVFSATLAKKVSQSPDQTLDTIRAVIDIDTHRIQAAANTVAAVVILRISPVVLKLRELLRGGLVTRMPSFIEIISELCKRISTARVPIHFPLILVTDYLQRRIRNGVIAID